MMQPIFDIRLAMIICGYVVIPVIGKRPPLVGWQDIESASRETLEAWGRDYPGQHWHRHQADADARY
jgi:hypothetical protein